MNDAQPGSRPGGHQGALAMSRTVRGGIGRLTATSCEVRADGSYTCRRSGADEVSGAMTAEQFALFEAVCHATDFTALPEFVDVPVTRTDSYLWTYRVGDHEVKVRDPDRAGEAVPAALRTLDALVTALEQGLDSSGSRADTAAIRGPADPPARIGDRLTNRVWDAPTVEESDR